MVNLSAARRNDDNVSPTSTELSVVIKQRENVQNRTRMMDGVQKNVGGGLIWNNEKYKDFIIMKRKGVFCTVAGAEAEQQKTTGTEAAHKCCGGGGGGGGDWRNVVVGGGKGENRIMAVMMGGDDNNNPIFHDFLGMSCSGGERAVEADTSVGGSSGGCGLLSGSSSYLGSGRKRCNSDSAFMALMRDRKHTVAPDSPEYACLRKSERPRRPCDADTVFSMQPGQKPASSSLILHPPVGSRPDPVVSKWELPMPMNSGQAGQSRFSQSGAAIDKTSPCMYRDSKAGAIIISQAAADEGSRTGIKGSGILNLVNSSATAVERNSTGMLPSNNKQRIYPSSSEPESSNMPSRRGVVTASRQMTIFYDGQAHVYDDVQPNKADLIMALAGSNGGSWSTTYGKSMCRPLVNGAKAPPSGENEMGRVNLAFSQNLSAVRANTPSQPPRVPVTGDVLNFITEKW